MLDLKSLKPQLQRTETISREQKIPFCVPVLIQGGEDFVGRKIIQQ